MNRLLAMKEMVTGIDRITEDNEAMLLSSEDVARLLKRGHAHGGCDWSNDCH